MPSLNTLSFDDIVVPKSKPLPTLDFNDVTLPSAPQPPSLQQRHGEQLRLSIDNKRRARKEISESRSGVKGFVAGSADWLTERTPFVGSGFGAMDATKAMKAAQRVNAGTPEENDFDAIADFVVRNEESSKDYKDSGTIGKAWSIMSRLPGFATEFAVTGGAASGLKAGIKTGLKKLLVGQVDNAAAAGAGKVAGELTRRSIGKKVLLGAGGLATTAALQTAINVPRLAESVATFRGPQFDKQGNLKEGDSLARGLTRGFADNFIENFTERLGGAALGKIAKTTGAMLVGPKNAVRLARVAERLTGAGKITAFKNRIAKYAADKYGLQVPAVMKKFANKAAYNGAIGEYMEERYGEAMRLLGNVVGLDLADPDNTVLANVANGKLQEALDHTIVEGIAFSVPGLAGKALGAVNTGFERLDEYREGKKEAAKPTLSPEAAKEWAVKPENHETALLIASLVNDGKSISRSDMEFAGLPKLDANLRNQFGAWVKDAVYHPDNGIVRPEFDTKKNPVSTAAVNAEDVHSSHSSQSTPGRNTDVTPNAAALAATAAYEQPNVNPAATPPGSQAWRGDVTQDPRWLAAREAGTLKPPPKRGLFKKAGPNDATMSPEELAAQPAQSPSTPATSSGSTPTARPMPTTMSPPGDFDLTPSVEDSFGSSSQVEFNEDGDSRSGSVPVGESQADSRSEFEKGRAEVSSFLGVPVEEAEHDPAYDDAIAAAKELGVDVKLVRTKGKYAGSARGKMLFINVDQVKGEDAVWYVAGHEIAHGTGVDKSLDLTPEEQKYYGDRYLARLPADSPYRKKVEADPELLKREAAAVMVGDFMRDEGFRKQVFAENRNLWDRIVDAVLKFFSGKKLSESARKVLNSLRDAKKQQSEASVEKPGSNQSRTQEMPPDAEAARSAAPAQAEVSPVVAPAVEAGRGEAVSPVEKTATTAEPIPPKPAPKKPLMKKKAPASQPVSAQRQLADYLVRKNYPTPLPSADLAKESKKTQARHADRDVDQNYQRLKQAADAERRQEGAKQAAQTKVAKDVERSAAQAEIAEGNVTRENIKYAELHDVEPELRKRIQDEARRLHDETTSPKTKAALAKVIKDAGSDVGAAVEEQKERIVGVLTGEIDQRNVAEKQREAPRPADPIVTMLLEPKERRGEMVRKAAASVADGNPNELADFARQEVYAEVNAEAGIDDALREVSEQEVLDKLDEIAERVGVPVKKSGGGESSFDFGGEADFGLQREPSQRVVPEKFENNKGEQRRMLTGMDALPGQGDLFDADNVNAKDDVADASEEDIAARIQKILMPPEVSPEPAAPPKKSLTGKPKSRPAVESAKSEFFDALDDLTGLLKKRGLFSNPQFDPEVIGAVSKVLAKALKVGVATFTDFLNSVKERYGDDAAKKLDPLLRNAWDAAQSEFSIGDGGNAAPQAKVASDSPMETTGTKNAKTDELAAKIGMPGHEKPESESFEDWSEEAKRKMAADPRWIPRLIEKRLAKPDVLDKIETAGIGLYLTDLNNRLNAGEDVSEEIRNAVKVTRPAGTEQARDFVARKMLFESDFSLASIYDEHYARTGRDPTEQEEETYKKQAERLEKENAELKALLEKKLQADIDEKAKAYKEQSAPQKKLAKKEALKKNVVDALANAKSAWAALAKVASSADSRPTSGGLDTETLAAMANAVKATASVVKAYAEMGVNSFLELVSRIKKDIGDVTEDQLKLLKEAWGEHRSGQLNIPSEEKAEDVEIGYIARQLHRWAVESGIESREEVIDAVHSELSGMSIELTRDQVMEAMSGYGNYRELSKDEISVKVREHRGEIQQILKLEDMQAGKAPKKTGVERREPTDEERRLIKLVNEAKKRGGYEVTDPDKQLKSALGAAKTAMRNRITDLEREIETREKTVKERTPLTPDAELTSLREQRDVLLEEHRKIFPPKKSVLSEAQRLKMAEKALGRQIATMEADLAAGRLGPKAKPVPVNSPALEAKRAELAKLKDARELARAASPEYQAQEAAKWAANYMKSLKRQEAFWSQRRDDARQGKLPVKKAKQKITDQALLDQQLKVERIKLETMQAISDARLASLKGVAWTADKVMEMGHLSRAIMTSFDLSSLGRQGGLVSLGHPVLAKRALLETLASVAHTFDSDNALAFRNGVTLENAKKFAGTIDTQKAEFAFMQKLNSGEAGRLRLDAGLSLSTTDGTPTRQEEIFQGRWGKHVPGIAASGRLYTMILNKLRADMFDHMVHNLGSGGKVTEEEAKMIAGFVNVATGRAELGRFNDWAPALNAFFFAPRYVASRFMYLATPLYLPFKGGLTSNWRVKRAIYKELGRTALGVGTVLGAVALASSLFWDDDDPEKPKIEASFLSSDAGKIRMGETRIDFLAGIQQALVLAARMATGQTKSSVSGEIRNFGEGFNPQTRWKVLGHFARTKANPLAGAAVTVLDDWTNVIGQKETPAGLLKDLLLPMVATSAYETMETEGFTKSAALTMLSILGLSTSTYGPKTTFRKASEAERKELIETDLNRIKRDVSQPGYRELLSDKEKVTFDRAITKSIANAADTLSEGRPLKASSVEEWKQRGESAFAKLIESGQSYAQIRKQYSRYLDKEYKDDEVRQQHMDRFTSRFRNYKSKQ